MTTTKFTKSKNECKQNGKERQSRSRKFTSISHRENAVIYDCDLYYFKYFHCCVHICNFLVCEVSGVKGGDFSGLELPQ